MADFNVALKVLFLLLIVYYATQISIFKPWMYSSCSFWLVLINSKLSENLRHCYLCFFFKSVKFSSCIILFIEVLLPLQEVYTWILVRLVWILLLLLYGWKQSFNVTHSVDIFQMSQRKYLTCLWQLPYRGFLYQYWYVSCHLLFFSYFSENFNESLQKRFWNKKIYLRRRVYFIIQLFPVFEHIISLCFRVNCVGLSTYFLLSFLGFSPASLFLLEKYALCSLFLFDE